MKKITITFLTIVAFFGSHTLFSQSIVNDKDGYVNVRYQPNKESKLIDTLRNGHIIYDMEGEGNWVNIDYFKNDKSSNGYIYKDRVKRIDTFKEIKRKKITDNKVILGNDSIEITVTEKKFEPKKHKFTYSKENKDQITLIDKKEYYGQDGGLPKRQYDQIKVKIKDKIIVLPKKAMQNLYEPSLYKIVVHYDEANNDIYIDSYNSDGAGGYVVVWKIKNGKYQDRYIFYGF